MKVGVFFVMLGDLPLGKALAHLAGLGCAPGGIGTGVYPGNAHCEGLRKGVEFLRGIVLREAEREVTWA